MSAVEQSGALERLSMALDKLFLQPGAPLSLTAFGSALAIAAGWYVWRRWSRGRSMTPRLLARALFPKKLISSPSTRADLVYMLFNMFVMGAMFGWAIMSGAWVSARVAEALTWSFGSAAPGVPPDLFARFAITLWLFLAYEVGYYLDHWSSHRIPMFWELHKVHHSAEVLTPITVFRVHPFESIKFSNILAVTLGTANGIVSYLYSVGPYEFTVTGANLILIAFMHLFIHLQHSHVWIPLRGIAGRIILSPAHHQVHHSSNPIHHDKNFGSCLAVWDWMFGTLHMPAKAPEKLVFGVDTNAKEDHSVTGVFIDPAGRFLAEAAKLIGLRPDAPTAPAPSDAKPG